MSAVLQNAFCSHRFSFDGWTGWKILTLFARGILLDQIAFIVSMTHLKDSVYNPRGMFFVAYRLVLCLLRWQVNHDTGRHCKIFFKRFCQLISVQTSCSRVAFFQRWMDIIQSCVFSNSHKYAKFNSCEGTQSFWAHALKCKKIQI